MATGNLYRSEDNRLVARVNYQCHDTSPTNWWGELVTIEYVRLDENHNYVIELEDSRKGSCRLRKRINGPVSGVPPRYIYHFTGTSELK